MILGVRAAAPSERAAGIGLLSPMYPAFGLNASVFYAPQPDLPILKIICYLGVLGIALGATAWYFRADRPSLRRAGAALLAAGLALTATAAALDATARIDSNGVIVPAFHNAAADRAVPYTPVCSRTPLPVCLHPAYAGGSELTVLATIINQIAAPVLGIPGMPARAEQVPDARTSLSGVQGNPPVLPIQPFIVHGTSLQPAAFQVSLFTDLVALSLFIPARSLVERATPAQRALALLPAHAGSRHDRPSSPPARSGGHGSRGALRGAKSRRPHRMADRPPRRAPGRLPHPRGHPVTPISGRLLWLHLLSRRTPLALILIITVAAVLRRGAALDRRHRRVRRDAAAGARRRRRCRHRDQHTQPLRGARTRDLPPALACG